MPRCVIVGCNENGRHTFPNDPKLKKLWEKATKIKKFKASKNSRLCYKHFKESDYQEICATTGLPPLCKHLKKGVVPSIFPWTPKPSTSAIERQNRYMERSAKKALFPPQNPIETLTGNYSMEDRIEVSDKEENLPDVQMEIEIKTHEKGNTVSDEPERSIRLVNSFTQTPLLNLLFSNYQLMTDDETILYYTGLESFEKFKTVLSTLLPMAYSICYRRNHVMNMSIEDQFLLMLMKLRRNLDDFILSKHFDISKSEVGNVFVTWINFVHQLWSKLNIWPSRELVDYFMPSQFKKNHKITRVIIDGTEVPITRPKNPKSQQATFSSYKHHNTIKFLVGSTPGGLLSYCSEGYGGSTSDRQIIERCNLIHKCNPGDGIMADRGFNTQDLLAPRDITLLVPNFLKGLSQLPGIKLKHDQKLAANRIHIERLIGLIKTYKNFKTDVNAYYVPLMSKIFFVCLMLCNFREKIVN
ncbi:uncharacterized protein LOC114350784 [Ostrinia furnacalis]|uniref:uncharacterized protein LOC114350784 n=1 Tax=Ostrinia furnacalis TaxID=93504 RepID=UPI0010398278|nr:uncharacterized protein LOC114350784 [Ostrinia furnacalis]